MVVHQQTMLRRRLRRCETVTLVLRVCAVCFLLALSVTWVQVLIFQAQAERAYQHELMLRQQTCQASLATNASQLFFKTCHIDLNSLLNASYRLGPPENFTCFFDPSLDLNTESQNLTNVAQIYSTGLSNQTTVTQTSTPQNTSISHGTESSPNTQVLQESSKSSDSTQYLNLVFSRKTYVSWSETEGRSLSDACGGYVIVPRTSSVPTVRFRQPCLKRHIEDRCYDGLPVPKVVHYVWFGNHTMDIVTFLSVLAAYRFLEPCLILFHADSAPEGPRWQTLLTLVPVLVLVHRTPPTHVFGRALGSVQHQSDIARMEALKEYGGIYLDGDQIVLRSLDEYRDKQFVMGHENKHNLANSLLISVPNPRFIEIWYKNYRSYNPKQWGIHSTFLPLALARIYPKTIHNAGYAFIKPDLPWIHELWEGHYDWSENHAVHLYYRSMVEGKQVRTDYTLQELTNLDSALGEITRHIVFGSKDLCLSGG